MARRPAAPPSTEAAACTPRAPRPASAALLLGALALGGCGGGAPLLHPAHVLRPGDVSAGAGLSGQLALLPASPAPAALSPKDRDRFETLTVAPAIAPWVNGRIGIAGDNEAGLTYTGRSLRLDARHAFALGPASLSVGLGASAIAAQRIGEGLDGSAVYGGGLDVPILFGMKSAADLYAFWVGPRAGVELLSGRVALAPPTDTAPAPLADFDARRWYAGFVVGFRVGFRHVHAALELGGSYHAASGEIGAPSGSQKLSLEQFTLTPGGALTFSF